MHRPRQSIKGQGVTFRYGNLFCDESALLGILFKLFTLGRSALETLG